VPQQQWLEPIWLCLQTLELLPAAADSLAAVIFHLTELLPLPAIPMATEHVILEQLALTLLESTVTFGIRFFNNQ
jgi:hypothetical protein